MKIISNCPCCGERGLHATGEGTQKVQQCINCGYVSSEKFVLDSEIPLEETEQYKMLSADMKNWVKVENGRMWIPTMMTLPIGMLYPKDDNGNMKWTFCRMLDIPEEERKNYPIPDKEGKFYKQRYDTDNPIGFNNFLEGLDHINTLFKEIQEAEGVYGGREHPIPDEPEIEEEDGLEYKG